MIFGWILDGIRDEFGWFWGGLGSKGHLGKGNVGKGREGKERDGKGMGKGRGGRGEGSPHLKGGTA